MSDNHQAFRHAARAQVGDSSEIEIEENAPVSASQNGAYVQAWVWVSNETAGIEPEDDGCPKGDPECLGASGDCHDACESPTA